MVTVWRVWSQTPAGTLLHCSQPAKRVVCEEHDDCTIVSCVVCFEWDADCKVEREEFVKPRCRPDGPCYC